MWACRPLIEGEGVLQRNSDLLDHSSYSLGARCHNLTKEGVDSHNLRVVACLSSCFVVVLNHSLLVVAPGIPKGALDWKVVGHRSPLPENWVGEVLPYCILVEVDLQKHSCWTSGR